MSFMRILGGIWNFTNVQIGRRIYFPRIQIS